MRTAWIGFLLALLTLASAIAFAQDEGTYRLQPGDVVRVQVFDQQQINSLVPVGKDGNISAPFVGIIRAEGKTTSELEADLIEEYRKKLRLREPRVSVVIEQFRPILATVVGAVARPGVYQMRPGDTVINLLGTGGSYVNNVANLKRATLRRKGSRELIPIDLQAMMIYGDMSQNYAVKDGDELVIPEERNNRCIIAGAVIRPNVFVYRDNLTVAEAIAEGGGPLPVRAKMSNVIVYRKSVADETRFEQINVDMVAYWKKGAFSQNITLKPGDMVYVSETKTPDLNQVGGILNTFFFLDRFVRDGVFGIRILR